MTNMFVGLHLIGGDSYSERYCIMEVYTQSQLIDFGIESIQLSFEGLQFHFVPINIFTFFRVLFTEVSNFDGCLDFPHKFKHVFLVSCLLFVKLSVFL
jgi:hypothetical protein